MRWRTFETLVLVAGLGSSLGCPKELPPDLTPEELFERGKQLFARERWLQARTAFERLVFSAPTHAKADSAQFLLAETYFQDGAYLTAASEFLKLAQTRPTIHLADDARYRACLAYGRLSPRAELDQGYTEQAIAECRALRLLYPQSPLVPEAEAKVAELRNKLARKMYLNGLYYFQREGYDSAILYFNELLKQYPEAEVVPAALYHLYRAYRRIGYEDEAAGARDRLLREFPNSPEARSLAPASTASGG
ncbi:MAG: outer membrane protein assembly factor BamD [Gemmatimonadetes bacterium]|nr:outer membrane protein assembly factor BamD [Gemmatimonadota bacterium]